MPHFRLIMVCLSYLFERCPRLDLKDSTIAVVIGHKRKIKKAMQLRRVLPVDQNGALPDPCRSKFGVAKLRNITKW
jgi:hypothetical protein